MYNSVYSSDNWACQSGRSISHTARSSLFCTNPRFWSHASIPGRLCEYNGTFLSGRALSLSIVATADFTTEENREVRDFTSVDHAFPLWCRNLAPASCSIGLQSVLVLSRWRAPWHCIELDDGSSNAAPGDMLTFFSKEEMALSHHLESSVRQRPFHEYTRATVNSGLRTLKMSSVHRTRNPNLVRCLSH